jgi:proline iminopeptidase
MEYAISHPERVSHLILMNTAPVSREDYLHFHELRLQSAPEAIDQLKIIASTGSYQSGDLETDAAYYRIHFKDALKDPGLLEGLVQRLRKGMTAEGIRKARAIEDRLYDQTWNSSGYDLIPGLQKLHIPTLVIHGDRDLIPEEIPVHVARAIPGARLVVLQDTGHFSYMENPVGVRETMDEFFGTAYDRKPTADRLR